MCSLDPVALYSSSFSRDMHRSSEASSRLRRVIRSWYFLARSYTHHSTSHLSKRLGFPKQFQEQNQKPSTHPSHDVFEAGSAWQNRCHGTLRQGRTRTRASSRLHAQVASSVCMTHSTSDKHPWMDMTRQHAMMRFAGWFHHMSRSMPPERSKRLPELGCYTLGQDRSADTYEPCGKRASRNASHAGSELPKLRGMREASPSNGPPRTPRDGVVHKLDNLLRVF